MKIFFFNPDHLAKNLPKFVYYTTKFMLEPTYYPNFSIVWLFAGLLDSLGGSEDIDAKWTSQSTEELLGVSGPPETGSSSFESRKLSPPLLAVLGDSSRCRSGSDPSISKPGFSNSDKASIGSFADRKARNNSTDTSFSSPKSSKFKCKYWIGNQTCIGLNNENPKSKVYFLPIFLSLEQLKKWNNFCIGK